MKLLLRYVFLLILIPGLKSQAQTCSIQAPLKSCKGDPLNFKAISSSSPIAYQWSFNGEGSSTVAAPVFIFNSTGNKQITLKLTFSGGATCTATLNIVVNAPPVPIVKLDTAASFFCLNGNNICIKDESLRGPAGMPIKQRVVVWGDGAFSVNSKPESDRSDCHSYSKTGIYDITIEITDSNACKVSAYLKVRVSNALDASFTYSIERHCDSTVVCLSNQSQYDHSLGRKLEWSLGGLTDSSANFCRTFTSDASLRANFKISNQYCSDTQSVLLNIKSGVEMPKMSGDRERMCYSSRGVTFKGSSVKDAIYDWGIYDSSNVLREAFHSGSDSSIYLKMPGLGKWIVLMQMTVGHCVRLVRDTVYVHGTDSAFSLINEKQCTAQDTVYACPKIKLYSTAQSNLMYLWEFSDALAPQCTSANTNTNCNWISTAFGAKHFYQKDSCYAVKLTVTDTAHKCSVVAYQAVSIGKPSLKELGFTFTKHCYIPGSTDGPYQYNFDAKDVRPPCGISAIMVKTDSARTSKPWGDILNLNSPYYIYDSVIDPEGWITLGLILKQGAGLGTSCNTNLPVDRSCSDTIWYHRAYRVLPEPVSAFYLDMNKGCKPLHVKAVLYLPAQKFIRRAIWNWDDGTIDTVNYVSPYISIAGAEHVYRKSGQYNAMLTLENENTCTHSFSVKVSVGYRSQILSDSIQCRDAEFYQDVEYFNKNTGYWLNAARANAGLEQMWWDFGDSSYGSGPFPKHFYKSNGTYLVKLITVDSTGCRDTITQNLHIVGPKAGIRAPLITSVCNEIITFYDSSLKNGNHAFDSIVDYYWDFGDAKNPSSLKDATHAYSNFGFFTITHIVGNIRGCYDTTSIQIKTIGPEPRFIIDGDSDGCQPFTVKLKNLSDTSTISDYIWKFGDPDSTTLSLKIDSSVGFTYKNAGTYFLNLTGAKSVKSPTTGNTYYCIARYPEQPLYPPIKVVVWPRPQAEFEMPDTVCPFQMVTLTDKSDPAYSSYNWYMSNGDSVLSGNPVTVWQTGDTGWYDVMYAPLYFPNPPQDQCLDSAFKKVYVSPVLADFEVDKLLSEDPIFYFTNKSQFGQSYYWSFGHESSDDNTSLEFNAKHNYDPDTGWFPVCLVATNSIGCKDTICKDVNVTFFPFVFYYNVFSPGKQDKLNDEFDIWIHGETFYDLKIYNRWGHLVYQSTSDAEDGESKNWNGRVMNTGEECPAGTYFYVFNYRILERDPKTVNGTVTLMR